MSKNRLYEGAPLSERYVYGRNKPAVQYNNNNNMQQSRKLPQQFHRQQPEQHQYHHDQEQHQQSQPQQQQSYVPGQQPARMFNGHTSESDFYQQQLDKELNDLNMNLAKLNQLSPVSKSSTMTDSTWSAPTTPRNTRRDLRPAPGPTPDIDSYDGFQSYNTSTDGNFKMDFDMKDFNADDVSLSLNDRELKINAKKKVRGGQKVSTLERKSRVRIPESIDPKQLKAKLSSDEGVLTIEAPTMDYPLEISKPDPVINHRGAMSEDDEYFGSFKRPTEAFTYDTNSRRNHRRHKSEYPSKSSTLQRKPSEGSRPIGIRNNNTEFMNYNTLPINNYSSSPDKDIPIKTYSSMSRDKSRSRVEDRQSNLYGTLPRGRSKQRSRSVGPSHRAMNHLMNKSMDMADYHDSEQRSPVSSMPTPVRTTTVRAHVPQSPGANSKRERRMTVSVFIGEGYRTDQLLVKNILPFDRFVVTAQPDTWQQHRGEYRRVFNWPAPVEASTISAFLRPDGTLTVTALMAEETGNL